MSMGRAFRVASFLRVTSFVSGARAFFARSAPGLAWNLKHSSPEAAFFQCRGKRIARTPRTMRTRIRLADGTRPGFEVTDAARAEALRSLAQALESAGVDAPRVTRILRDAAPATPAEFARFEALAAELSKGKARPKPTRNDLTFRTARAPLDVW